MLLRNLTRIAFVMVLPFSLAAQSQRHDLNRGQTGSSVRFLSDNHSYTACLIRAVNPHLADDLVAGSQILSRTLQAQGGSCDEWKCPEFAVVLAKVVRGQDGAGAFG